MHVPLRVQRTFLVVEYNLENIFLEVKVVVEPSLKTEDRNETGCGINNV